MKKMNCNICGKQGVQEMAPFYRCLDCSSFARMRVVAQLVLTYLLNDTHESLADASKSIKNKKYRGLGLTDHHTYSHYLEEIFDYKNTFYHCEPKFDIADINNCEAFSEAFDFILATDVFEHVKPPCELPFKNSAKILKKEGILFFSVPTHSGWQTIEHYPRLYKYKVVEIDSNFFILNKTKEGGIEVYSDPIFHGGVGEATEMRFFSYHHVLTLIKDSGFEILFKFNTKIMDLQDELFMKKVSIKTDARSSTFFVCKKI